MKFERKYPRLKAVSLSAPQELRIIDFMEQSGYIDHAEATFMRSTVKDMVV